MLDIPHMAETLADKVRRRLDELSRNPFEAARLGSLERGFVNDILQGKKRSVRGENLARLAVGLDWTVGDLVDEPAPTKRPISGVGPREIMLPVRYEVAAGAWQARDDLRQDEAEPVLYPAIEDPRYVGAPQWLELVRGDSYNRRVPEGARVHVVDAIAIEYEPANKDTVVVERSRAEGAFAERTLKEVRINKGKILLYPRSFNEKWADPINYTKGLGDPAFDEVRIVGLVIRAYIGFEEDA